MHRRELRNTQYSFRHFFDNINTHFYKVVSMQDGNKISYRPSVDNLVGCSARCNAEGYVIISARTLVYFYLNCGCLLVKRWPIDQKVVGSNPTQNIN